MRGAAGAALFLAAPGAGGVFVKGTLHQHAVQPQKSCHRAPEGIEACGPGCMNEQDDGGTDADALLSAVAAAKRGYAFVGLIGNEEPPLAPKKDHGLVTLSLMENQMAAVCTKGTKKCSNPCDPVPPKGAGPWSASQPPVNDLHREYIEGVPGVWVQHPCTDPAREEILSYMTSGQDNLRGMEVYNSWVEQAWDAQVPLDDAAIDALYPIPMYRSMSMHYWDATLRALKRPVYGLADDDGFVYMGDNEEPIYPHEKKDTSQTDGPAWFRFGQGWSMVDVPSAAFTAADVSAAIDAGRFYASTGVTLEYNTSGDVLSVRATEPVVFAAAGGGGEQAGSAALAAFNVTLCADPSAASRVTNAGCAAAAARAPPPARELRVDLSALPAAAGSFFFVRVQAYVRTRYPIAIVPQETAALRSGLFPPTAKGWVFGLGVDPAAADLAEGRVVRVSGGDPRRPFVVQSVRNRTVTVVSHFSDDDEGDITPNSGAQGTTTVKGIVAGTSELVAERWAWMQPVFRARGAGGALSDPFASAA